MNDDKQTFDQLFKTQGGLFDRNISANIISLETIEGYLHRSLRKLKRSFPNMPDVYLDFIESLKMNACITESNHKFYLGITIGMYFILFDMYNKIFSSKNLSPRNNQLATISSKESKCCDGR